MQSLPQDTSFYCTFYIVRHGQTVWNIERRLQGQQDSPLTEEGIKEVHETKQLLNDIPFDAVFSSDMGRAMRTAEIVTFERNLTINAEKLLRERNFGKLEGTFIKDLGQYDNYMASLDEEQKKYFKVDKDAESDDDLISRFTTFLRETGLEMRGKKVLVVTHSGMIRALLIHIGFGTYKTFNHDKRIHNGAYVKLLSNGIDFFIAETYRIDTPKDVVTSNANSQD